MHFSATLTGLGLLASTAHAAPFTFSPSLSARQDAAPQNVLYWGQNGGGLTENPDLANYCSSEAGVDIVVLSFLYQYGNGVLTPSGTIGQSCFIGTDGKPQACEELATAIDTCKSNGVKVILSLGGASGSYSLSSQEEAVSIGQNLWDAYGNSQGGGNSTVPRPFGATFVDGWDFDIEASSGNENYQYMIETLRSNFASDSANAYFITGAPQCPVPEPNMDVLVKNAQFDYLFVQFYNNPGCSVSNGDINFNDWKTNVANTPSADAKIFIGVPASPLGATGTESGAQYYLEPPALATLVGKYTADAAFGGIMMWAAAFSDANVNNGCTYAQQAHSILTTGAAC